MLPSWESAFSRFTGGTCISLHQWMCLFNLYSACPNFCWFLESLYLLMDCLYLMSKLLTVFFQKAFCFLPSTCSCILALMLCSSTHYSLFQSVRCWFFPSDCSFSTPYISVSMQVSLCGMAMWFVGYLLEMLFLPWWYFLIPGLWGLHMSSSIWLAIYAGLFTILLVHVCTSGKVIEIFWWWTKINLSCFKYFFSYSKNKNETKEILQATVSFTVSCI